MVGGIEVEIPVGLVEALETVLNRRLSAPEPIVLLARYIDELAKSYGLSEHDNVDEDPLRRVQMKLRLPRPALDLVRRLLPESDDTNSDAIRNRLYDVFNSLSEDELTIGFVDDVLSLAQIYWNLEQTKARPRLPIRKGIEIRKGGVVRNASIAVPTRNDDFAAMNWSRRIVVKGAYTSSSGGLRKQGACLAVLAAINIINDTASRPGPDAGTPLGLTGAVLDDQVEAGSRRVSIRWPVVERTLPERSALDRPPRLEQSTGFERIDVESGTRVSGVSEEREIAAALGCQMPTIDAGQQPDWRRLLNGAALRPPEVLAGLAVPRTLFVRGHGAMDEQSVLEWMKSEPQQPLFLTAPSGEGKSTYCTQLMSATGRGWLLLRLVSPRSLDWHQVARLQELMRARLSLPSAPPALLVWEFNSSHLEAPDRNLALDVIQSLSTADFPGPVSLFVAGLPSVIGPLCAAARGTLGWFEALDEADVAQLTSCVRRCVEGISATAHQVEIDQQFPNVRRFLALDARGRQELLLADGKPLIAGMLEASFGVGWRSRVTSSYDELSRSDRLAYLMVCLGTLVAGGVSSSVVLDASPDADIDARSQYDPWIADDAGNQTAIHATVARAVLELCPVDTAVGECLTSLRESAVQRRGVVRQWCLVAIQRLLRTLAHWAPLAHRGAASESVRSPAQLRRITRRWVTEEADRLLELVQMTAQEVQWAYVWFEVVEGTIPSDAERGDLNQAVVDVLAAISAHADRLPTTREGDAHCLAFMRSLTAYWTRRFADEKFALSETADYVNRWIEYIEEPWVDRAFLFSVQRLGVPAFFDLAYSGEAADRNEALLSLCDGLGVSFLRLDAEVPITGYLEARYAQMVSNVIPTLWPDQAVGMLSALWLRSNIEGRPSFGTAASLVRRLKLAIASSNQSDAAGHRARLTQLLTDAVQHHGVMSNMDLVVEYVDLVNPDDDALGRCEQIARDALVRLADNRRTVTFAHDVLSRAVDERREAHRHLLLACDGYSSIIRDQSDVVAWDGYWKSALARLRRLDPIEGERATRARADRLRRIA